MKEDSEQFGETYPEYYINTIEKWFMAFQSEMKKNHKEKKDENYENVEGNIELIEKQLEIVDRAIKHINYYREYFLYKIYSQLIIKVKGTTRHNIHRYAFQNAKEISRISEIYKTLSDETQEKIKYFNNFADIFFILLEDVKKILEKQKTFLNDSKIIKDEEINIFKKGIIKTKHSFNNKVYWDFEKLLDKEEELFSSFFEIFNNEELEKLWDLNNLLNWYREAIKYTFKMT